LEGTAEMGRTIQIRVDEDLVTTLENIRKEVALKTKQEFGVENLEVPGTSISRILANRINRNKKKFGIKVRKINGRNHGVISLGDD
jgi:hypothetical protein